MSDREPAGIARGSMFVSVQADADSPLADDAALVYLARACARAGAAGLRINSPSTIAAVRSAVDIPILGINKIGERTGVFITPDFASAAAAVRAGADLIAVDGTPRPRPDGSTLADLTARIHDELDVKVMADIDSLQSALHAENAGVDYVGTTLAGYTDAPSTLGPDLDLIHRIASGVGVPCIAEGRLHTPEHARAAFDAGAWAVVVGQAITSPEAIIRRFHAAITPGIDKREGL